MFVKENLNPKGKKTSDCVIRAISKAEEKTWLEVFDALTKIARTNFSVLNDKEVYGEYLKKYPIICAFYHKGGVNKRFTVNEVCQWKGIYIVQTAKHLTVVIDGKYYDNWDCGRKAAYKIWKIR